MSSSAEKIKERLGIVDVLGGYIRLERAGSNFKARCPFHNERTPSFFVSPLRQSYHCFGCNRGGDIFSFVQEIEGMDFLESLKLLGARAGVDVLFENPKIKSEKDHLYKILEDATSFFEAKLQTEPSVVHYLEKRGLSLATIKDFRVGFAPSGWQELYQQFRMRGHTDSHLEKAGLLVPGKRRVGGTPSYYDRFRNRIMFPIVDLSGRVIAFSGRITEGTSDTTAKYINSPQSILYDKGSVLYGYQKGKDSVRKENICVLVEGQMDVILAHQAGFFNTVAVGGTALTARHIGLIKRLTDTIVLAFDSDRAGIAAMERAAKMGLALSMNVLAYDLGEKKDPADFILEKKDSWAEGVRSAPHVISYLLGYLKERFKDARMFKLEARKRIVPLLGHMTNAIDQAHFVSEVAQGLGIREESVHEELKRGKTVLENEKGAIEKPRETPLSRKEIIIRQLLGIIQWQSRERNPAIDVVSTRKKLMELLGKDTNDMLPGELEKLAFEAEACYGGSDALLLPLDDLFLGLEEELVREELLSSIIMLRNAEKGDDERAIKSGLLLCQTLTDRLSEIKTKRISLYALS